MLTDETPNDPPVTARGSKMTNKPSEVTSKLKSTATELGQSAAKNIDESKDAAAGGLASAAAALHEHAEQLPGGERVATFAHTAADKLNLTADYIRNHDTEAVIEDVKILVKNNPVPALLGAVFIGFLLGRTFSSAD